MKIIKWTARILSLCILIFALPFYFGYGNPLPFINQNYSIWENISLLMMPIIFIGLIMGWIFPKIGAFMIIIPMLIGFSVGALTNANFSINLLLPIIPGILYLINDNKK